MINRVFIILLELTAITLILFAIAFIKSIISIIISESISDSDLKSVDEVDEIEEDTN